MSGIGTEHYAQAGVVENFDWRAPETVIAFGSVALGLGMVVAASVYTVTVPILGLDHAAASAWDIVLGMFLVSLFQAFVYEVLRGWLKKIAARYGTKDSGLSGSTKYRPFGFFGHLVLNLVLVSLIGTPLVAMYDVVFGLPLEDSWIALIGFTAYLLALTIGEILMPGFLSRWGCRRPR